MTPSLRRTTPTRPRPPAPTPAKRLVVRSRPKVLDLTSRCQPHIAQLQHPVCTAWDERNVAYQPLPYAGPTSLNLYIVPALSVYSVLLPFVSTLETLLPATFHLTLDAGWSTRDDGCVFVFSWLGVFVTLATVVVVLFALHRIFPSKGRRAVRCLRADARRSRLTFSALQTRSRAAKGVKRKAAAVPSATVVARSWFPAPAQPILEPSEWCTACSSTQEVHEFAEEVPAEVVVDIVEAITTALGDEPLSSEGHPEVKSKPKKKRASKTQREAAVVEAVLTSTKADTAEAIASQAPLPRESWIEVGSRLKKASKPTSKKRRPASKLVQLDKAPPRSTIAPRLALCEEPVRSWSEHKRA